MEQFWVLQLSQSTLGFAHCAGCVVFCLHTPRYRYHLGLELHYSTNDRDVDKYTTVRTKNSLANRWSARFVERNLKLSFILVCATSAESVWRNSWKWNWRSRDVRYVAKLLPMIDPIPTTQRKSSSSSNWLISLMIFFLWKHILIPATKTKPY